MTTATPERQPDVSLRDVEEADLPILFEHQLDPEANRMGAFKPRSREAFVAHWATVLRDETVVKKAVLVGGEVAGNVVSFERDGEREVGYWIAREHWGKGVATQALSQLLKLVTERPLYAYVAKRNVASLRVLQKCGFEIVKELRPPPEADYNVEEYVLVLR